MKHKYFSYFKLSFLFFLTVQTKCFASGPYSDPTTYADRIKYNHTERTYAFNHPEVNATLTEKCTTQIDTILTNKRIVSTSKTAGEDEAKTFLQSIMARVVIHGNQNVYGSHGLESGNGLFGHFEILRLTEQFSFNLYEQYSAGFVDASCLSSQYQDLQKFNNNLSLEKFATWFDEVLQDHNTGLYNRFLERIKGQSRKTDFPITERYRGFVFNNIKKTDLAGLLAMPYIDTYKPHNTQYGIHLKINENTFISIAQINQEGGKSYTVRLHPYVMPTATASTDQLVYVSTSIEMGKNKSRNDNFVDVSIKDNPDVYIHPGEGGFIAISPDNKHLTNLPHESLKEGEAYSFVSSSRWSGGIVKVFHLIVGDYDEIAYSPLYLSGKSREQSHGLPNFLSCKDTSTYSEFLRHFANNAYNEEFSKHYAPHLRKLMTFIESLT